MRKVVVVIVVLGLLAVAADRISWYVAEHRVATVVQRAEDLSRPPAVSIQGIPFLTQVAAGVYSRVDVTADEVERRDWTFTQVEATLLRVQVPLGELVHGSVQSVPVGHITAQVRVTYAELQRHVGNRVRVSYAGGAVRLAATVRARSHSEQVTAEARLSVDGSDLVITPQSVTLAGGGSLAGTPFAGVATQALQVRLPLPPLPYGARLTGVQATPSGLRLSAAASDVVLQR